MPAGYWKLVEEVASRSDFRPSLAFWKKLWPVLVGDEIALRSSPCGWQSGTLIVEVEQGGWEAALKRARPAILSRLRELPWEIEAIELLPGHVPAAGHVRQSIPRDLEQVELPEEAQELLEDADLDKDIAMLAGRIRKHLEWEKKSS